MTTEHTHTYCLTAAQCNAQREVSPATLVQQIIDVATEHADILNIGFKRMGENSTLWVLSRAAYEISRYPRMLETYTVTTWIEGYNKLFSDRDFAIRSASGELIGYARTVWMAIDKKTRRPTDLAAVADSEAVRPDLLCDMARPGKIRLPKEHTVPNVCRFGASDIDFNRHVTSRRYVEIVVDQLPLEVYDTCVLSRFEIAYSRESLCGEQVSVVSGTDATGGVISAIMGADGAEKCITRSKFVTRDSNQPLAAEKILNF